MHSWELAPWLRGAHDLRKLTIVSQNPGEHIAIMSHRYVDVIALFYGIKWPKLKSLHFGEILVRPKSLLRFLSEHTRSLKSVRVENSPIPATAWKLLASEFEALKSDLVDCVVNIDTTGPSFCNVLLQERLEDDRRWIP